MSARHKLSKQMQQQMGAYYTYANWEEQPVLHQLSTLKKIHGVQKLLSACKNKQKNLIAFSCPHTTTTDRRE